MNNSTVFAIVIAVTSVALQIDFIVYWIGPAGCLTLIPMLIIVLALPWLNETSELEDIPQVLTSRQACLQPVVDDSQFELNQRQLLGLKQMSLWVKSFIGSSLQSKPFISAQSNHQSDLLDRAEKIKITERIKPDGVRERSVMIFYPKQNLGQNSGHRSRRNNARTTHRYR